jgi:hypothetical protein
MMGKLRLQAAAALKASSIVEVFRIGTRMLTSMAQPSGRNALAAS